ncbi:MAG: hypothetical protein AABY04_01845 [Candidatus Micrarchaeota archaeon]
MVQAIIDISEKANNVLNVVKAKFHLAGKSQAIEKLALEFEKEEKEREEVYAKMMLTQKLSGKIPFTKSEEEWMDKFDWHPADEKAFRKEFISQVLKRNSKSRYVEAKSLDELFGK